MNEVIIMAVKPDIDLIGQRHPTSSTAVIKYQEPVLVSDLVLGEAAAITRRDSSALPARARGEIIWKFVRNALLRILCYGVGCLAF